MIEGIILSFIGILIGIGLGYTISKTFINYLNTSLKPWTSIKGGVLSLSIFEFYNKPKFTLLLRVYHLW